MREIKPLTLDEYSDEMLAMVMFAKKLGWDIYTNRKHEIWIKVPCPIISSLKLFFTMAYDPIWHMPDWIRVEICTVPSVRGRNVYPESIEDMFYADYPYEESHKEFSKLLCHWVYSVNTRDFRRVIADHSEGFIDPFYFDKTSFWMY